MVMMIGMAYFLFGLGTGRDASFRAEPTEKSLQTYVESCLTTTSEQALELLGRQGGHTILPNKHFGPLGVSFLYDEQDNLVPSIAEMELELSSYIEANIGNCLDFLSFKDIGFAASMESPDVKVTIAEKDVVFGMQLPVTLERDGEQIKRSDFFNQEDLQLKAIWNIVNEIVSSEVETNGAIDSWSITDGPQEIWFVPYEKVLIVHIIDSRYAFTSTGQYDFFFANKR